MIHTVLVNLQRWAVENGYRLGSEMRMIYFRGPMHRVAPADYLTELNTRLSGFNLNLNIRFTTVFISLFA